jgi:hypothetical protein
VITRAQGHDLRAHDIAHMDRCIDHAVRTIQHACRGSFNTICGSQRPGGKPDATPTGC